MGNKVIGKLVLYSLLVVIALLISSCTNSLMAVTTPAGCGSDQACTSCVNTPHKCNLAGTAEMSYSWSNGVCNPDNIWTSCSNGCDANTGRCVGSVTPPTPPIDGTPSGRTCSKSGSQLTISNPTTSFSDACISGNKIVYLCKSSIPPSSYSLVQSTPDYNVYDGGVCSTGVTRGSTTFVGYPTSVVSGNSFNVQANIKLDNIADSDCTQTVQGCRMLFELGETKSATQAIIPISPTKSACDASVYFSSQNTIVKSGDIVQANFQIKAPSQLGDHQYKVGVHKGCGFNAILLSNPINIKVVESVVPPPTDVKVYCLSSDKKTCASRLNNCESSESKYTSGTECEQDIGGGGGTGNCKPIGGACDGIDYSGTNVGHTYSTECGSGFCWEDAIGTNVGRCQNPVCCQSTVSLKLQKNSCTPPSISVDLSNCKLYSNIPFDKIALEQAKANCGGGNGSGGGGKTEEFSQISKLTYETSEIRDLTSTSLLDSVCRKSTECTNLKPDTRDVVCRPIATLRADGTLTEVQQDSFFDVATTMVKGGVIGGGIGATVCIGTAVAAIVSGGVSLIATVPGVMACTGLIAAGASLISGALDISFSDSDPLVKSIKAKDSSEVGLCVYKDKSSSQITNFVEAIGKSINNLFGGKIKTGVDDLTMGWIGAIFIILLAFLLLKS